MKKILSLLGAFGLIATTAATTISCNGNTANSNSHNKDEMLENAWYDDEGNIKLSKKEVEKIFKIRFFNVSHYWTKVVDWKANKNTLTIKMWNDYNGAHSKTEEFEYTVTAEDMDILHSTYKSKSIW